eukprot:COSAG01_NODE_11256_length_1971_cov_3.036325_1_plen_50_part_10
MLCIVYHELLCMLLNSLPLWRNVTEIITSSCGTRPVTLLLIHLHFGARTQ